MRKVVCIMCGNKVRYYTTSTMRLIFHKGVPFMCNERSAYCLKCGCEVYVPKINDWNAKEREKAYQKVLKVREE